MSDLSKPKECAQWIREWLAEPPGRAAAHLSRAAREQRANLTAFGRTPNAVQVRCVEAIERAAKRAQKRADVEIRRLATVKAQQDVDREARAQDLRERFPARGVRGA